MSARTLTDTLIGQKVHEFGSSVRASSLADQLAETDVRQNEIKSLVADLDAYEAALRSIPNNPKATEMAEIAARAKNGLLARVKPTKDESGGAQGHAHSATTGKVDPVTTRTEAGMALPDEAKAGAQGFIPAAPTPERDKDKWDVGFTRFEPSLPAEPPAAYT